MLALPKPAIRNKGQVQGQKPWSRGVEKRVGQKKVKFKAGSMSKKVKKLKHRKRSGSKRPKKVIKKKAGLKGQKTFLNLTFFRSFDFFDPFFDVVLDPALNLTFFLT